jgi:competence protein ComEC
LRDGNHESNPKRLVLYSGATGQFWQGSGGQSGDGLTILAPTLEIVADANKCGDYNDCSYVILYQTEGKKILFGGDSNNKTWEHILAVHAADLCGIDLLIAPHHGRKSDRAYDFLDILQPKLTFFGNARAEHLAYSAWDYRNLNYITNNQANCMVVHAVDHNLHVYVTNEAFARKRQPLTFHDDSFDAWYLTTV